MGNHIKQRLFETDPLSNRVYLIQGPHVDQFELILNLYAPEYVTAINTRYLMLATIRTSTSSVSQYYI